MAYGTINADVIQTSTSGGILGAGNASIMKNRIINGAMVIDQRNAGASVTPANGNFTLDRWCIFVSQTSKLTIQQNAGSVTPPAGFANYLGVTSSSAYSVTSNDYFNLFQKIEGYNIADLAWGTASAKSITVSFWVRSSLTGTFSCAIQNSAIDRSYPFTYTVNASNTWEQKSVTIPGDTSGTWLTTNGTGLYLYFGLGLGSSLTGSAGAWASAAYYGANGATSVVGTSGATFYITGVQLEVGSSATGFEYRQYTTELALCQRYYEVIGSNTSSFLISVQSTAGSQEWDFPIKFLVSKRATPTVTQVGTWTASNCTNLGAVVIGIDLFTVGLLSSSSGRNYIYNTTTGSCFTASAEL